MKKTSRMSSKKILLVVDGWVPKSLTDYVHKDARVVTIQEDKLTKATVHRIQEELRAGDAKFIGMMGSKSLKAVMDKSGILKIRGMPIEEADKVYFPMLAPGYLKRFESSLPLMVNDLESFSRIIKQGKVEQQGFNFTIVDLKNLSDCLDDLSDNRVISFDTETSGLDQFAPGGWITSLGFGTKNHNWCIPLNHADWKYHEKWDIHQKIVKKLNRIIKEKKLIAHNGKFDSIWVWKMFGFKWLVYFDTLLAHHLLDENSLHDLTSLAGIFLKAPSYDIPLSDKWGITGTAESHCKYLSLDVHYTRQLYRLFKNMLMEDISLFKLFRHLVMPMSHMYVDAEIQGVYISKKRLALANNYWTKKRNKALDFLHKSCPSTQKYKDKKTKEFKYGINWDSPNQISEVLFGPLEDERRYGLKKVSYQKLKPLEKTDKGGISTAESTLLRLDNPVAKTLLEYKEASKNLGTFVEAWQSVLYDGYIHPTFKIHGTVTGRPSCLEPNLQQTPRDPRLRGLISAPPGWTLIDADYSQVELRLAAMAAGETRMLNDFADGADPHWTTLLGSMKRTGACFDQLMITMKAAKLKPLLEFEEGIDWLNGLGAEGAIKLFKGWKELRKKAKAENFGFLYGMWWRTFIKTARNSYGVEVTDAEAKQGRESFFALYPEFDNWHRRQKSFVRTYGYVRSMSGRMRRLPAAQQNDGSYEAKEAERQAINSPIQGFAAEINLMASVELYKDPRLDHSFFRLNGTVHDSNLMICRDDKLDYALPIIHSTMVEPKMFKTLGIKLTVPLGVDIEVGPWSRGEPWKGSSSD
jgi:DNA polymerase I-like protein with 3'-5' exonuclease and polymerase domains